MGAETPRRVAFLGLGLIGGSAARALRRGAPGIELVAWTPSGAGPAAGVRMGVLAAAAPDAPAAIAGADLVVLAGPPLAVLELIDRLAGDLRGALAPDATVTDVASTKVAVMARAAAAGLAFIGGHPMAGRDASGYAAGDADLFNARPWVVVEPAGLAPIHRARVEWLARACGAVPLAMDATTHDAATAAISHLPLVVAAALVEAVLGADAPDGDVRDAALALAASGWRDMTRLARGDAAMGAGILATNAPEVAGGLRALRAALDGWIGALEATGPRGAPDAAALERRLAAARRAILGETDGGADGGAGRRAGEG